MGEEGGATKKLINLTTVIESTLRFGLAQPNMNIQLVCRRNQTDGEKAR